MKRITVFLISVLMLSSCNAQTDKESKDTKKDSIKPKVDFKVNKEYDENGNLIKYDSIYTYYYSNIDKNAMMNDSIFKKFNEHFNTKSPFIDDSFFNDFFREDMYSEDAFFSEDFFRGNSKKNQMMMMNKILSKMDSLKNEFFIKQYPLKEEKKDLTNHN